jgi:hypothetical protein
VCTCTWLSAVFLLPLLLLLNFCNAKFFFFSYFYQNIYKHFILSYQIITSVRLLLRAIAADVVAVIAASCGSCYELRATASVVAVIAASCGVAAATAAVATDTVATTLACTTTSGMHHLSSTADQGQSECVYYV